MKIEKTALVAQTNERKYTDKNGTNKISYSATLSFGEDLFKVSVKSQETYDFLKKNYGKQVTVPLYLKEYKDNLYLTIE